jgi:hypothetical protein
MSKYYSDFTKRMQARFPDLLAPPPNTPYNDWGLETPRGWDGLMERFFEELDKICAPYYGTDQSFQLAQAKSKFASLCVYVERCPAEVRDQVRAMLGKYEQEADTTCEASGKAGATRVLEAGWVSLLHPDHHPKQTTPNA